jgi:hypothetical protein
MSGLWKDVKPLVFFGWVVAAIRFALEFTAPQQAWYFGVYWLMPIALLYFGLVRHRLDHLSWPRLALAMILVGMLVWFVPNAISYSTAQFQGWTHGRFAPNVQSAPIAPTPVGKIRTGVVVGFLTGLAGSVWCIVWSTLLVWLPAYLRRRHTVSTA